MVTQDANLTVDFQTAIAAGIVPGWRPVPKFGNNPDADSGTVEDVWTPASNGSSRWQPPAVASTLSITSTSANDTGTLRATGVVTEVVSRAVTDAAADFVAAGVQTGDILVRTSTREVAGAHLVTFGYIVDVTPTRVTYISNEGADFAVGESYAIAGATGSGAAAVLLEEALDDTFIRNQEVVILDGSTPVSTFGSYRRLNRARVILSGAAKRNEGRLDVTSVAEPGLVFCDIPALSGRTQMAIYTVPANERCYIYDWYAAINRTAAAGTGQADINAYTQFAPVANAPRMDQIELGIAIAGGPFQRKYSVPRFIPPATDIVVYTDNVTNNNSSISAGLGLALQRIDI